RRHDRRYDPYPELPSYITFLLINDILDTLTFIDDISRLLDNSLSDFGKGNRFFNTIKNLNRKFLLQLLDLHAERRLCDKYFLRCFCKVLMFGNGKHIAQLGDGHKFFW